MDKFINFYLFNHLYIVFLKNFTFSMSIFIKFPYLLTIKNNNNYYFYFQRINYLKCGQFFLKKKLMFLKKKLFFIVYLYKLFNLKLVYLGLLDKINFSSFNNIVTISLFYKKKIYIIYKKYCFYFKVIKNYLGIYNLILKKSIFYKIFMNFSKSNDLIILPSYEFIILNKLGSFFENFKFFSTSVNLKKNLNFINIYIVLFDLFFFKRFSIFNLVVNDLNNLVLKKLNLKFFKYIKKLVIINDFVKNFFLSLENLYLKEGYIFEQVVLNFFLFSDFVSFFYKYFNFLTFHVLRFSKLTINNLNKFYLLENLFGNIFGIKLINLKINQVSQLKIITPEFSDHSKTMLSTSINNYKNDKVWFFLLKDMFSNFHSLFFFNLFSQTSYFSRSNWLVNDVESLVKFKRYNLLTNEYKMFFPLFFNFLHKFKGFTSDKFFNKFFFEILLFFFNNLLDEGAETKLSENNLFLLIKKQSHMDFFNLVFNKLIDNKRDKSFVSDLRDSHKLNETGRLNMYNSKIIEKLGYPIVSNSDFYKSLLYNNSMFLGLNRFDSKFFLGTSAQNMLHFFSRPKSDFGLYPYINDYKFKIFLSSSWYRKNLDSLMLNKEFFSDWFFGDKVGGKENFFSIFDLFSNYNSSIYNLLDFLKHETIKILQNSNKMFLDKFSVNLDYLFFISMLFNIMFTFSDRKAFRYDDYLDEIFKKWHFIFFKNFQVNNKFVYENNKKKFLNNFFNKFFFKRFNKFSFGFKINLKDFQIQRLLKFDWFENLFTKNRSIIYKKNLYLQGFNLSYIFDFVYKKFIYSFDSEFLKGFNNNLKFSYLLFSFFNYKKTKIFDLNPRVTLSKNFNIVNNFIDVFKITYKSKELNFYLTLLKKKN